MGQTVTPSVTAIIPARGKSQGIPRKNARMLAGTPLLLHVVEAAKRAERITRLVVSTDDSELAELARRAGVDVLERPERLSGPEVPLDDVIVDALQTLVAEGSRPDYVVTLQPTCPLLRPATIDAAIARCHSDGLDTVLSVVRDAHLTWGLDSRGAPTPNYAARVNRQSLPPVFRETGAVVVARTDVVQSGTRFGAHVSFIETPKLEAIDIDDHFDWWLAEKSLQRRRVVFHVVASPGVGTGHVHRALTLADRLIDHEVRFLVNTASPLAEDMIRRRFYPVDVVSPGEELAHLEAARPDLVVNDVLDTDADFVLGLREAGIRVVNFEDQGPGSVHAHAVINAMYGAHPSRQDARVFHGLDYCCLRDEFYTCEPVTIGATVNNILVAFGGTDPTHTTERVVDWLDRVEGDFAVTVLAGVGYPRLGALTELAARARHPVEVVHDSRVVSRYMAGADLAITSAGRTVFELAALAVPMVVIPHHERERSHLFASETLGAVCLPASTDADQLPFDSTLKELLSSRQLRSTMNQALRRTDVRGGLRRVLGILADELDRPRNQPRNQPQHQPQHQGAALAE